MRMQLAGLFRRRRLKDKAAAESLRARRQGHQPHAQGARPEAGQFVAERASSEQDICRCYGCTGHRAVLQKANLAH